MLFIPVFVAALVFGCICIPKRTAEWKNASLPFRLVSCYTAVFYGAIAVAAAVGAFMGA